MRVTPLVAAAALLCTGSAEAQIIRRTPPPTTTAPMPAPTIILADASGPIWGFADLHVHQHANLGFGGLLFWGQAYGPQAQALRWCTDAHGAGGTGDRIGNIMTMMNGHGGLLSVAGHAVGGDSQFDGWPRWNSYTHQQVYADWLKRAHEGGLRLMVMYAVNNKLLCDVAKKAPGRTCNDMEAVEYQVNAAKAMQSYIDAQAGGPGRGWYRIVYSPAEARTAIGKGQLAVVLGMEVDEPFNCRRTGGCTPESVRRDVQKYYDMGVRQIFPIHIADNGFGGAAVYNDLFNFVNLTIAGDYFRVRDCRADGVEFRFGLSTAVKDAAGAIAHLAGRSYSPPAYPNTGQCNSRGLTPLGEFLIRELMSRQMLIDVDHMSWLTAGDVIRIASEPGNRYPLIASHTGFMDVSRGDKRSEGQKTAAQLEALRQLQSLVAPIVVQGESGKIAQFGTVPNDCSNSSKTFAQAYLYAVHKMGGPVAIGSDFNGLAGLPAPRFGTEACPGDGPRGAQSGRVTYPVSGFKLAGTFPPSTLGSRTFDINQDGFAHIGMYPDFIQDLRNVGVTDAQLDPLFRSAEAYVKLWETIAAKRIAPPVINSAPVVTHTVQAAPNYKVATTVVAKDARTGAVLAGTVSILNRAGQVQATGPTGSAITFTPCAEFDTELRKWLPGDGCAATVVVPNYPTVRITINHP